MSARGEFVIKLRELEKEMRETEEAFLKYTKARDEANLAFCLYSNRFGFTDAVQARDEALKEVSQ